MQPPFHRLDEFATLTDEDIAIVQSWLAARRIVRKRNYLRREGDTVSGVFFLEKGWVTSSIILRDGRRQIVKVHLPGDMLGFPSLALSEAGETLEAISDATICHVPAAALAEAMRASPRLSAGLFLSTQWERVSLMHELCWVGATPGKERVAAFLLDLHERLTAAGLVHNDRFSIPLTQQHIGELLGLTPVHVNRVLRKLDADGCIERGRGWMRIIDISSMKNLRPSRRPNMAGRTAWARISSP